MKFKFLKNKPNTKIKIPSIFSIIDDYNQDGDFYDFSNGFDVSDNEKQEWVKKTIEYLNKNPNEYYYYTGCGNSMVIGFKSDDGVIEIIVVNSYMSATIVPD